MLRYAYLSGEEILLLCREPCLAPVFNNPENWSGRTLVFELKTEADLEQLVYFCSRYLLPSRVFVRIHLPKSKTFSLSDAMLGQLVVLGLLLHSLDIRNSRAVTDVGVAHLAEFKSLQSLNLSFCESITDGGVAHLIELKSLQSLGLRTCSKITDGSMVHLAKLKSLQSLDLSWCERITDVGCLAELKFLRILDLTYCEAITNEGAVRLAEIKSLQSLRLRGCRQITDRGVELLRLCLPNTEVIFTLSEFWGAGY